MPDEARVEALARQLIAEGYLDDADEARRAAVEIIEAAAQLRGEQAVEYPGA